MNSEKNSAAISNLTRRAAAAGQGATHACALGAAFLLACAVTVHPRRPGRSRRTRMACTFIWSGLKTHGAGQHDYPQFLADWSKVLTEKAHSRWRAACPSAADLEHTDVVVLYKESDAQHVGTPRRRSLQAYVKRGGGLVSLHDSLCVRSAWIANVMFGGGKKHGETNFTLDAPIR